MRLITGVLAFLPEGSVCWNRNSALGVWIMYDTCGEWPLRNYRRQAESFSVHDNSHCTSCYTRLRYTCFCTRGVFTWHRALCIVLYWSMFVRGNNITLQMYRISVRCGTAQLSSSSTTVEVEGGLSSVRERWDPITAKPHNTAFARNDLHNCIIGVDFTYEVPHQAHTM